MARILAIDYGKKRVGMAVTDPQKIIANQLATVETEHIWDFLNDYLVHENVERILVGYPLQMNATPSESVVFITPFVEKLKLKFPTIPVEMTDERFTSKMAFQAMIDGGLKKMQRRDKGMIDRISATIMLQTYLDFNT